MENRTFVMPDMPADLPCPIEEFEEDDYSFLLHHSYTNNYNPVV